MLTVKKSQKSTNLKLDLFFCFSILFDYPLQYENRKTDIVNKEAVITAPRQFSDGFRAAFQEDSKTDRPNLISLVETSSTERGFLHDFALGSCEVLLTLIHPAKAFANHACCFPGSFSHSYNYTLLPSSTSRAAGCYLPLC